MKPMIQLVAIAVLLIASFGTYAQGNTPSTLPNKQQADDKLSHEKIKTLKIAFLTNKLELTASEAQVFWPIYNEYQDKKLTVNQKRMDIGKALKRNYDQFSDAELNKLLDEYIALKQQETNLEVEYLQKFRQALPVRKIAALQKAERDFKMEVLHEYKKRCEDSDSGK